MFYLVERSYFLLSLGKMVGFGFNYERHFTLRTIIKKGGQSSAEDITDLGRFLKGL
jgi:hypothetical protein